MPKKVSVFDSNPNEKSRNDFLNKDFKHYSSIFDKINVKITQELFRNQDIKSSEISSKLKIPLSTVQRRRTQIERSGYLLRKLELDPEKFGLRIADLLINVSKGDCDGIAKEIVNKHRKNVLEVSIRIGISQINLIAKVTYKNSEEVFDIIRSIRRIDHVDSVEWSEIVRTVVKNEVEVFKTLFE